MIMSNPKVSIIIPCFNGEKYLREAIDSALAQTYENIEVIVVNDGSSDGTENIALEYGDKIRYFKKENGGVSSALNLGISKMEGEYFSWLSHDDLFLPEKTEKQVNALLGRQEKKIFVYSNFTCLIEKDGSYQRLIPANRLYGDLCEKSAFPVLFNLINGCTVLIHKSLFEKYGLFDETLSTSQDYDMWMKLLFDNEPIYLEESLVITRIHDKQGSKTISEFSDNCQRQQIDMVRRLDDKKIEYVFAGKYKLFADMIELSIKNEWDTCVDTFYSAFEKEDEPKKTGFTSNIYIYGAGTNGHKILEECHIKGVNVKAVIDRRSELWGHNILGTECKPLCDIPYESEIWIAVEDDLVIKQELIAQGFTVKDFTETNVSLFNALPTKNRIYELVNTYRKRRRG